MKGVSQRDVNTVLSLMKKGLLHIFIVLCASPAALGQQDAQFTQYMFNTLFYNPAFSGVDGVTRVTATHRSQWLGYQSSFDDGGAPTTQILSINTPVYKLRGGAGFYVLNDQLGALNNLEIQGSYAYQFGFRDSKLSLGIRVGAYAQTLDFDKYRAIDKDDPFLTGGRESQVRPDLAAGLFYRREKYYVGVGVNHLLRSEFDFGENERNALENHLSFVAGYYYDVNFDLQIHPTVLVKTDFNGYSFDFGAIATVRNTMWGGLSFRQSEAAILIIGYNLLKDKSLKAGYALDYIIKDQQAKETTSHELMLSYELPVPRSGKKIIRTPRYRH